MKLAFYFLVVGLFAFPGFSPAQEESPDTTPKTIAGLVHNQNDEIVAKAEVQVSLSSSAANSTEAVEHGNWKTTTDAEGKFQIDVKQDIPKGNSLRLSVWVGAEEHYTKHFFVNNDQLRKESVSLDPFKLSRGVLLTGRVIAPAGQPKAKTTSIELFRKRNLASKVPSGTFYEKIKCDADGKFEIIAPNKAVFVLTARAANYRSATSVRTVEAPESSDDDELPKAELGDFQLRQGTAINGTATLKNGKPAAGVVMVAYQHIPEGVKHGPRLLSVVKTDRDGKFQMPPHGGKCSLFSLKECRSVEIGDGKDKILKTDGELPLFGSVEIDLEGKPAEFEVNLKEVDSVSLSGVVRDGYGNPVPGVVAEFGWETEFGKLIPGFLKTDRDGKYEVTLASGDTPVFVWHNHDVDGTLCNAVIPTKVAKSLPELFVNGNKGILKEPKFHAINSDVAKLDWSMLDTSRSTSRTFNGVKSVVRGWFIDE